MRPAIAWVLVVAACASERPERLTLPFHRPPPEAVQPPDPTRRDPLSELARAEHLAAGDGVLSHAGVPLAPYRAPETNVASPGAIGAITPVLIDAPTFGPVARDWPRVCERRGRMPDDELLYVEAWCAHAVKGDDAAAARGLHDLVFGATTPGLAAASLDDYAVMLARSAGAAVALEQLRRAGMSRAIAAETLGRTYLALGRDDDARAAVRGWDSTVACTLDLRAALEGAGDGLLGRLAGLEQEHCSVPVHAVRCRLGVAAASERCEAPADAGPEPQLAWALVQWPSATTAADWQHTAEHVLAAMPARGAERLAVAALANALVADCAPATVAAVTAAAAALRRRPDHDPKLDPHVAILVHATPAACRAMHAVHVATR